MNKNLKSGVLTPITASWLAYLEVLGRSPKTLTTYEAAILNLNRFLTTVGRIRAEDVQPADLEAWRLDLVRQGRATSTVDLFVRATRSLFSWMQENGHVFTDPSEGLVASKVVFSLGLCPSEEAMRKLLTSVSGRNPVALRDRAILETAYATGARLEELAQLTLPDITRPTLRLYGKRSRERMVPLTTAAINALDAYLKNARPRLLRSAEDTGAVFLSNLHGRQLSSHAIALVVKGRSKRCGLRLTPHALRRAFATHLLLGGAALVEVKDMLGHQSFRHLRHYLCLEPGQMLDAVREFKPCRR